MKPTAYIWDIDGVIADSIREDFKLDFAVNDFSRFEANIPAFDSFEWAVEIVRLLAGKHMIIFLTARNEAYREDTVKWLEAHLKLTAGQYEMHMRKVGDYRKDVRVKADKVPKLLRKYDILAAFDDKLDNSKLYSFFGIKALHVI